MTAGAKISQGPDEFAAGSSAFSIAYPCVSMSLPYHVGNGVFGGLVPAAGASISAITGIPLSGLFYPMAIAAVGVVVSRAFLREPTHRIRIWDEVRGGAPPLAPDQP